MFLSVWFWFEAVNEGLAVTSEHLHECKAAFCNSIRNQLFYVLDGSNVGKRFDIICKSLVIHLLIREPVRRRFIFQVVVEKRLHTFTEIHCRRAGESVVTVVVLQ